MRLFLAVLTFAFLFKPIQSFSISWKFIQPPKVTLELFWKKTTEHHYHNTSTSKEVPLDIWRPPYTSAALTDMTPAFDAFGGGARSQRNREDELFESTLFPQQKLPETTKHKRHQKTVYIQVDVKNNALRRSRQCLWTTLFIGTILFLFP